MRLCITLLISCALFQACKYEPSYSERKDNVNIITESSDSIIVDSVVSEKIIFSEKEKGLICLGLVDIQKVDSSIHVDLKYSSTDNFLGLNVYLDLENAYLQPDVAIKLSCAQEFLKAKFPYYNLLVYDAVRPRSIQQLMWDTLKMPLVEKVKYLSNPQKGSLHNYGAAVDLSIVDSAGKELDMGTGYDHFGELAYPVKESLMLKEGKLSQEQVNNRKLLREVMSKAGFFNIQTEWWHFNSCTRQEAANRYTMID